MCHTDLVTLLLPYFGSNLEAALTDRQGTRAIALVFNSASPAAARTIVALERGSKGSVVGKFPANEIFELAARAGDLDLAKLAGNFPEKIPRVLEAILSPALPPSAARALWEQFRPEIVELPEMPEATGGGDRDGGCARQRIIAELKQKVTTK